MKNTSKIEFNFEHLTLELFNTNRAKYELLQLAARMSKIKDDYLYCLEWKEPTNEGTVAILKPTKSAHHYHIELYNIFDDMDKYTDKFKTSIAEVERGEAKYILREEKKWTK